MTGLPDGYRWDCGINRPPCADALPPATIDAYQGPLPDAVTLDGGTTVIQRGGDAATALARRVAWQDGRLSGSPTSPSPLAGGKPH